MRKILTSSMIAAVVLFAACSKQVAVTANSTDANSNVSSAVKADVPVVFPFKDFPAVETAAKEGEYVLVPSYNWIQDAVTKGADKVTFIWYSQKMKTPGKDFSEVEFLGGELKTVPNAYIVAIPKGQEAKKGDVVITWWQSGSGLQRAIVVDDKNPAEPMVRYLDTGELLAKEEQLKPNSFFIAKENDPGTSVAIEGGGSVRQATLIREAGDKVFVVGFAGKVSVHPKSAVKPVPLKVSVNPGDKVKAVWVGSFTAATVKSVDARNGRVTITWDSDGKEAVVVYGEIIKE